jgi:hypothetical protein
MFATEQRFIDRFRTHAANAESVRIDASLFMGYFAQQSTC